MAEDKITEKVYCYDHPSAYKNDDALIGALMPNRGDGANSQWNNPFIYLVWMMFAQRMWGGNDVNNAQIESLRNQMADNQNSNMLMEAVKGNSGAIAQLASSLNCNFNALSGAICDVRAGVDKLAGQVGFSAERVINAVNMGDCNVIQALKDCCCTTQKEILKMGYENQLNNEKQTNFLQGRIDQLANGVQTGFATVGYETQRQTCDILNSMRDNTQKISDLLNAHWNQELQLKYQDAKAELSQNSQTLALTNQLNALAAAIAKIPTTTTTA